ncbi:PDR/VanB family oxidoreductase [Methylobacterium sp. AMS5]|uniref:PDR/VanB family oxidoreductase n=1 Tax=Methylobacterium sp. AMS5 TaxID=925818 RepID=UPI00074F8914|nr:PDR/VanB family oxidoreductase [Methylobacterium sp. AMS5]AMB47071.1 diguanylate cyclase [Methylobacterium sp. AMS5]
MHARPEWQGARLREIRDLTPDIRLFTIEPERFERPSPGSNIAIGVRIGERPDTRRYSLVGLAADGLYRIAVKRLPDSRGGSAYLHGLAPGARLTISAPANHFPLNRGRPDYLLVAGGIGITPIYGMAVALAEAGAPVRVLYTARAAADLAFADSLRERLGARLRIFLDERGERIDLAAEIARLASGGELYICGPIGLREAAQRAWAASGRPIDGLRFETFGSSGRYPAEPFRVRIPRLSREILVPHNQSLLDALEAAGIAVISDCRRGECGLCAVKVLDLAGRLDHRDVFLSDAQKDTNAQICTCVSRVAGGNLSIDIADRS